MFEKLLSLVPYNPGLVHQLSFYSRRMREEAGIRRTGLIFIVIAFMIQFVAVLSPPQSTVADSPNDIVNGGFSTKAEARKDCIDNVQGYQAILHYYGISCSAFDASDADTLNITVGGADYYSVGRNPSSCQDTPANIDGAGKIYWRKLSCVNLDHTYQVIRLRNSQNKVFYLMYKCGNLVFVGGVPSPAPLPSTATEEGSVSHLPTPPPPPPVVSTTQPDVVCTGLTAATTTGQQSLTTRLTASYSANQANLVNGITFNFGDGTAPYRHNGVIIDHTYTNNGTTAQTYTATVTINTTLGDKTSDVCKTTVTVTPPNAPPVCPSNPALPADSPDCYCKVPGKTDLPKNSDQCFTPCEYNGLIPADNPECKPCDKSVGSSDALACVEVHKTASNITAGIADANNTTAKGGDVITYTLFAQNKGKATVKDFTFQENINDVLDYADVTDLHGGTLGTDNVISWPKEDIKAGDTASHQVTVKVKDPIPQTPVSSSDPMHFDLMMTNVYGNTVNIKLPPAPAKQIETVAASLPNTGPGTTLFLAAAVVVIAGYFYGRARLLATESEIAVKETNV